MAVGDRVRDLAARVARQVMKAGDAARRPSGQEPQQAMEEARAARFDAAGEDVVAFLATRGGRAPVTVLHERTERTHAIAHATFGQLVAALVDRG